MLTEIDGCIFDEEQYRLSRGLQAMDPVGKEAFVNHIHFSGDEMASRADEKLREWKTELFKKWPGQFFRLYREVGQAVNVHGEEEPDEIIVRFHKVREGVSNWCDEGCEIFEIET